MNTIFHFRGIFGQIVNLCLSVKERERERECGPVTRGHCRLQDSRRSADEMTVQIYQPVAQLQPEF